MENFHPPAPFEWNGERVLRTEHLIEYYDCEEHQIFDNFRRKNAGFIEDVHYVVVAGKDLSKLRMNNPQMQISPKARRVFFWTVGGAELQAKMLNTAKAWEAFKILAETYFLVKVEVTDDDAIDFCTEMSPVTEGQPGFFEHEQFGKVRVVMIDGKMWFVGIDIAKALKYTNPQKALRDHVPDKFKKSERIILPKGGAQSTILIDEAGLYKLILRSKMPAAEEFSDWICSVVIPSIRQTGLYTTSQMLAQFFQYIANAKTVYKCVYIHEMSNGTIKIGNAQDFLRRMRQIETHSGLNVVRSCHTDDLPERSARRLESDCHASFADDRILGEFFSTPFEEAREEVNRLKG